MISDLSEIIDYGDKKIDYSDLRISSWGQILNGEWCNQLVIFVTQPVCSINDIQDLAPFGG